MSIISTLLSLCILSFFQYFYLHVSFMEIYMLILLSGYNRYFFWIFLAVMGFVKDELYLSPGIFFGSMLAAGYCIKKISSIYEPEKSLLKKYPKPFSIDSMGGGGLLFWVFIVSGVYKISLLILTSINMAHYYNYYFLIFDCLLSSLFIFIGEVVRIHLNRIIKH